MRKRAIIIGAGPAGLTAAWELLARTDIVPIVIEKSEYIGGIARTHRYNGNRIDIGGHRFFSKNDRVMRWWADRLPVQRSGAHADGPDPEKDDRVMLVRTRKSRIYFLRKFFDYPIAFSVDTLRKLGFVRVIRIGLSYLRTVVFPLRRVDNLEQFFISRFGRELYRTFFKSYTEKVWGVACNEISAEWGGQRIKGLSVMRTLAHFVKSTLARNGDIAQKNVETSLIEQFLYPKYGPGQLWEQVADEIRRMGGEILTGWNVETVTARDGRIVSVAASDPAGEKRVFAGAYFISTMPVQDLVRGLGDDVPAEVREISEGLMYRDFITAGLLVNKLLVRDTGDAAGRLIADNWIYVQEPDVCAGRLQIFNNWSPYLVADPSKVWIGVEYFCYENDPLWRKADREMADFAAEELHRIGIIDRADVVDWTVLRTAKAYPAYFGAYQRFGEVREYLDGFENLFLVGRNGMHKYNNQDHSMLTAMMAVDQIAAGCTEKADLWLVNTEQNYHEEQDAKQTSAGRGA